MKETDKQLGEKLRKVLKKIRDNSYRTLDGYKPINHWLNYQLEIESEIIQRQIGWRNKKAIIKELDEAGIPKGTFKKRVDLFRLKGQTN